MVTAPDGASTTTYFYQGNQTTVTDPAGKWKTFTTDAMGNLTTVAEPSPPRGAHPPPPPHPHNTHPRHRPGRQMEDLHHGRHGQPDDGRRAQPRWRLQPRHQLHLQLRQPAHRRD